MNYRKITVVITTHNRREEVVGAVDSCLRQSVPCEVLVYDDASAEPIQSLLSHYPPSVKVIRSPSRVGYIALRNRGFREASGEIVVSIDDDAYFSSPETLSRVIELFSLYPDAGAFALPYVEPNSGRETMPVLPVGTQMCNYIGCAHAIERQVALSLGGYLELLVHQGEERDLTIRMIDSGHDVLMADTPPIVHLYSPNRDHSRLSYFGYRNTILFCWIRIPFPDCVFKAVTSSVGLLLHRFRWRWLVPQLWAIAAGWFGLLRFRQYRQPVSRRTYREYTQRARHGPIAMTEPHRKLSSETLNVRKPEQQEASYTPGSSE